MKKIVKHIISIFLIVIGFCFLIFSCTKKVDNFYVRQELKDWGYYEAGSQWQYRNDSTGEKETVLVNNTEDRMIGGSDIGRFDEAITISINSSFLRDYILNFACNGSYATDDKSSHTDKLEVALLIENEDWPLVAIWPDEPMNENKPLPCAGETMSLKTEIINDYNLDTNHFTNVLHTTLTKVNTYKYEFYFAKHIGLLHFNENNTFYGLYRSYSLESWNVRQ
jgi:hypothetical protein